MSLWEREKNKTASQKKETVFLWKQRDVWGHQGFLPDTPREAPLLIRHRTGMKSGVSAVPVRMSKLPRLGKLPGKFALSETDDPLPKFANQMKTRSLVLGENLLPSSASSTRIWWE
jgi:hypothetical protein